MVRARWPQLGFPCRWESLDFFSSSSLNERSQVPIVRSMTDSTTQPSPSSASSYGPRRAAQLMVALGNERASQVLAQLNETEVSRLTWLVAHTESLESEQREDVLRDFYASLTSREYVSVGGPEAVQRILVEAFGEDRAAEMQTQLGGSSRTKPFKFLERVATNLLAEYLKGEHPQLVALILAMLNRDFSAEVLSELPEELQAATLIRMVSLTAPAPEAVELTEAIVEKRLSGAVFDQNEISALHGTDQLIDVLRQTDIATQQIILSGIDDLDAGIAAEVRRQMFTFEDLALLDGRSLQRVLREIDQADLMLALRAANAEVQELIFANMSTRAAQTVREDMEVSGLVRIAVVQEAQNRIVSIVRALQDSDEIVIDRGGEDALVA